MQNLPTSSATKDLRVVELIKTSSKIPLSDQIDITKNHFICLGHFDCFKVRKLGLEFGTLAAIEADLQQNYEIGNNYMYPIYLLHYPDTDCNLDDFWDTQFCCTVISRVHFDAFRNEKTTSSTPQDIQTLKSSIHSLTEEDPASQERLGDLDVVVGKELVHISFYHTLELGDVVVCLKSNSLTSCLRVIQQILETASVGDVYSYCGIHTAFLTYNSLAAVIDTWAPDQKGKSRKTIQDFLDEPLSSASIRFSVRTARCADEYWKYLPVRKELQFVVGTADALYHFKNCELGLFIEYIRNLITKQKYKGSDGHYKSFSMYDAFDDVISRVGIPFDSVCPQAKALEELGNADHTLQDSLQSKLTSLDTLKDHLWFSALTAQTNSLITMMGNCVTDDLTILLWPSVVALLDRLKYCSEIEARQDSDIHEFLNAWDILENDILHLEGQLVQNPELQSSRHYTPAALMVFYMSLLHHYDALLRTINQDKGNKRFVPLITYDLTSRANTLCILDDRIQDEEYCGKLPLLVSIPPSLMYKPFDVSIILCHETSHYTGDATRKRDVRLNQIIKSCAGRIAEAWMLDGRGGKYLLRGNCSTDILGTICESLHGEYLALNTGKENSCNYIYQIRKTMPTAVRKVLFNQKLQSMLAATYMENKTLQQSFISYAKTFSPQMLHMAMENLEHYLENFLILYRECYADLVAILCLGLKREDYFLCMFNWECNLIQNSSKENHPKLEMLYFQAALVLDAVEQIQHHTEVSYRDDSLKDNNENFKMWDKRIKYYKELISKEGDIFSPEETGKMQLAIQAECVSLRTYLYECAKEISTRLSNPEVKKQCGVVQNLLKIISVEPDFKQLHDEIARYKNHVWKAI